MTFKESLIAAKSGDQAAMEKLLLMYRPLLLKESIVNDMFDEDLYQELCIIFLSCVTHFNI